MHFSGADGLEAMSSEACDINALDPATFSATVTRNIHGQAGVTCLDVHAPSIKVRGRKRLSDKLSPMIAIAHVQRGRIRVEQGDAVTVNGAGEAHIIDFSTTFRNREDGGFSCLVTYHSHDELAAFGINARRLAGQLLPPTPYTRTQAKLMALLLAHSDSDDLALGIDPIESAVAELTVAALRHVSGLAVHPETLPEANRARAIVFIAFQLSDPHWGIPDLAAHLGASERYVYKIFADHGQRPYDLIKHLRIRMGIRLLSDPSNRQLNISDVAKQAGYAGAPQLSRAIREATGLSPSEWKQQTYARRNQRQASC